MVVGFGRREGDDRHGGADGGLTAENFANDLDKKKKKSMRNTIGSAAKGE